MGNRMLLITDGKELYVFGAGVNATAIEGMLEILEDKSPSFTLLVNPNCKYVETCDEELQEWGFETDEEGLYINEMVDEFPVTLSSMGLTSKEDTDPLRVVGKSLNVPKDWFTGSWYGGTEGKISGGNGCIEYLNGDGVYQCRYFSGRTAEKSGYVWLGDITLTIEQVKELLALNLQDRVMYE